MLKAIATDWNNNKISHWRNTQIWILPVVFFETINRYKIILQWSYKIIRKRSALLLHCSAPCSGLIWRYSESPLGYGEAYLLRFFGFSFSRPPLSFPFCAGLQCWFQPLRGTQCVYLWWHSFSPIQHIQEDISLPGQAVSLCLLLLQHHIDGPSCISASTYVKE